MILQIQQRQNWIRSRRERRKLAKRARLYRQILRYVVLLVLFATGISAFKYLHWALTSTNTQVIVNGNQVVSVDQVKEALGNIKHRPLYQLNPKVLETKVCALEDAQRCFVRRYVIPYPRLVVYVLEEFPWASVARAPGEQATAVISESGRVIPIAEFPHIICPSFTVCLPEGFVPGSAWVAKWSAWVANIAAQTNQPVSYVDMRVPDDIRVQAGELNLKTGSADASLTRRLSRLASIIPTVNEFKDRLVYIDLSLENNVPIKVASKSIVKNTVSNKVEQKASPVLNN